MLRSWKERACQTGCFEVVGIALVAPVYTAIFGASLGHGVQVIALLSVVIMLWSPLHNTLFDFADWRMTGRTACQRPKSLRLVHAVSHEASAVLLTCPILVWFGHGLAEALAVNLQATVMGNHHPTLHGQLQKLEIFLIAVVGEQVNLVLG